MITDTIVAPATPSGKAGISVIRMSGKNSLRLLKKLTKNNTEILKRKPILLTVFSKTNKFIDKAIVTYFKKPKSYTGEDVIELSCHGNPIIVKTVINTLCFYGARISNPGEFTMRAFLNGKMDLVQAESVSSLIEAKSTAATEAHNKILDGLLTKEIKEVKNNLLLAVSIIEYELDISEETTSKKTEEKVYKLIKNSILWCEKLLKNYTENKGRFFSKVVICGEPNVGKSTLLNALVGRERAIVSSIAGTTRDRIEETIEIDGSPITIIDTAGIRKTKDKIEKAGLKKTKEAIKEADILIHVISKKSKKPIFEDHKKNILVFNKVDLFKKPNSFVSAISVSAKTGYNIEKIKLIIQEFVENNNNQDLFLTTERQSIHIEACYKFLKKSLKKTVLGEPEIVSLDLKDALKEIDSLTGETTVDDVLDVVFSNFCVGK